MEEIRAPKQIKRPSRTSFLAIKGVNSQLAITNESIPIITPKIVEIKLDNLSSIHLISIHKYISIKLIHEYIYHINLILTIHFISIYEK